MMQGFRLDVKHVCFWTLTIVAGLLVIFPIGLLVLNSFRDVTVGKLGFSLTNMTLGNYWEAYSNPRTYTMLLNSIWFAVGSLLVAVFLGGTLAFLSERTDLPFRKFIPAIVMVPLIMPSVVKGIAWIFLLSPRVGLLNQAWKALGFNGVLLSAYSLPAMIWVEGISMSTLAFLMIGATIRRMDPTLEEAAAVSGVSTLGVLTRVTLPLLIPGFAGVFLLLFIRGIESFEIPMLLGFNSRIFVFSTNIYYTLRSSFPPDYGLGFAYSLTLVVLTVSALLCYQRMVSRAERFTVVAGKGYRSRLIPLGRWRYLGWAFMGFYSIVGVLLPFLILIWSSLLPYYQTPSKKALAFTTLANYGTVVGASDFWLSIKNTAILTGGSSLVIMFVAVISSWFIHRTTIRGRKILDFIIFLPYAVSGMCVGVAFMILFLSFDNPLYGTIWIIGLAYLVNYLPIGSRFTHAAVLQIHKELEEAAWASGSGFWRTLRCIWIPLLLPALINGALYVAVLTTKVMSIAVLLYGPDSMVLSVYLWRVWDGGNPGEASALAVILIVVMGGMTLLARRLASGAAVFKDA
ncbi:MAG: iron ABC transporter permease [Desulfobacterales bacterium]|nr:iron ABC transporter permease [Desulfobacterales bacterium]